MPKRTKVALKKSSRKKVAPKREVPKTLPSMVPLLGVLSEHYQREEAQLQAANPNPKPLLTQAEFGARLGVKPPNWSRIRRGENLPGPAFFGAVVQRYPHLQKTVISTLIGLANGQA